MDSTVDVLIVEDSLTQALQLRRILEAEGHIVVAARNGVEALADLRAHRPALVITDVNMPEMDGYELCRRIKNDPNLKDLPVILLTSLSDPEDIMRGLECGADNFVTKPYEREHLLSRIRDILMNWQFRTSTSDQPGIDVFFGGRKRFLTAERTQILDLLLASFETAVTKTRQLEEKNGELSRALETIKSLQANYYTLLESNPDGMIVVEKAGSIRYANQAATDLIGEGAGLIGRRFLYCIDPGEVHQLTIPREGADPVIVEQRTIPINWEGQPTYLVSLRDITALVRMQEEIQALSLVDELTGLHNRRGFFTIAAQEMRIASRSRQPLSLLFIDLDNMKAINDELGHAAGDTAIVAATSILRDSCREADLIARMGGDEFVVLLVGAVEAEAANVAARIREGVERHNLEEPRPYLISLSVGFATREATDVQTLEELLHLADQRMYEVKQVRRMGRQ